MSYCRKEDGKDFVFFVSPEDQKDLPETLAPTYSAIDQDTGEIDWDCPCLGKMTKGPCADDFKAAFSCFVFSTSAEKGSECLEQFRNMQDCFSKHPEFYAPDLEEADAGKEQPQKTDAETQPSGTDHPSAAEQQQTQIAAATPAPAEEGAHH